VTNVPTIIADENMPALELFSGLGEVRTVPGRPLPRAALAGARVLLVRSVTRVDEALLAGSAVQFVGSATIGTDHVDLDYLARAGIRFAHAPGCNAMAVAEYVLQTVLAWALEHDRVLQQLRVGLVGLGNVGRNVAGLLEAAGCTVVASDPPQADAGVQTAVPLGTLEQVLACDVISLHVPLTTAGPHPTHHLLDAARLAALTPAQLLINTCRGAVIDNLALQARLEAGQGPVTVLEVWCGVARRILPATVSRARCGAPGCCIRRWASGWGWMPREQCRNRPPSGYGTRQWRRWQTCWRCCVRPTGRRRTTGYCARPWACRRRVGLGKWRCR